jgi:hypothetical protein
MPTGHVTEHVVQIKAWHLAYILNFLIIRHHKGRKLNGNFQGILIFKEEFPDKKADVFANQNRARNC